MSDSETIDFSSLRATPISADELLPEDPAEDAALIVKVNMLLKHESSILSLKQKGYSVFPCGVLDVSSYPKVVKFFNKKELGFTVYTGYGACGSALDTQCPKTASNQANHLVFSLVPKTEIKPEPEKAAPKKKRFIWW